MDRPSQGHTPEDEPAAVDPTRICWTQWLRANADDAAAAATGPPLQRTPAPPLTLDEIERLFKDC